MNKISKHNNITNINSALHNSVHLIFKISILQLQKKIKFVLFFSCKRYLLWRKKKRGEKIKIHTLHFIRTSKITVLNVCM